MISFLVGLVVGAFSAVGLSALIALIAEFIHSRHPEKRLFWGMLALLKPPALLLGWLWLQSQPSATPLPFALAMVLVYCGLIGWVATRGAHDDRTV